MVVLCTLRGELYLFHVHNVNMYRTCSSLYNLEDQCHTFVTYKLSVHTDTVTPVIVTQAGQQLTLCLPMMHIYVMVSP